MFTLARGAAMDRLIGAWVTHGRPRRAVEVGRRPVWAAEDDGDALVAVGSILSPPTGQPKLKLALPAFSLTLSPQCIHYTEPALSVLRNRYGAFGHCRTLILTYVRYLHS